MKILVVDDCPVNLKIINKLLGDEYEVMLAGDGRTAIQLATSYIPDLILLDILMPEMDGYAVCRCIKNQEATAEIPIIFITVVSESNSIVKGFEAGAQDYIIKPFGSEELRARIKTHLELKKSKEEVKAYARQLEEKNLELNKALIKLEIAATKDYLTDLPNRRYMMQRFEEEVARLRDTPGEMALILADVDEFKRINDQYGHVCGDQSLKAIADAMLASTSKTDIVSRWGGDEFLILLPDTDMTRARAVAAKILETVGKAPVRDKGREIPVTITLGVTVYDPNLDIDGNVRMADEDLYARKRLGSSEK